MKEEKRKKSFFPSSRRKLRRERRKIYISFSSILSLRGSKSLAGQKYLLSKKSRFLVPNAKAQQHKMKLNDLVNMKFCVLMILTLSLAVIQQGKLSQQTTNQHSVNCCWFSLIIAFFLSHCSNWKQNNKNMLKKLKLKSTEVRMRSVSCEISSEDTTNSFVPCRIWHRKSTLDLA